MVWIIGRINDSLTIRAQGNDSAPVVRPLRATLLQLITVGAPWPRVRLKRNVARWLGGGRRHAYAPTPG